MTKRSKEYQECISNQIYSIYEYCSFSTPSAARMLDHCCSSMRAGTAAGASGLRGSGNVSSKGTETIFFSFKAEACTGFQYMGFLASCAPRAYGERKFKLSIASLYSFLVLLDPPFCKLNQFFNAYRYIRKLL